ncbi:3-ketoacyl-CoA synthase 1-like protein [Drosera capensis]
MCITTLGLSILPTIEKLRFVLSIIRKQITNKSTDTYTPNFKTVIDHFCLPISGLTVIKEIGKRLKLNERDMEPVMSTLHRFGNQSSSSLWYELAYIEAKERVKKGDKVWQMGMGSGVKCASAVWECVRPIVGEAQVGPWCESIDKYPRSILNGNK